MVAPPLPDASSSSQILALQLHDTTLSSTIITNTCNTNHDNRATLCTLENQSLRINADHHERFEQGYDSA